MNQLSVLHLKALLCLQAEVCCRRHNVFVPLLVSLCLSLVNAVIEFLQLWPKCPV